jgi:hypothetical protein
MQFEVSDEAAIAMASGFYAALADDYPVDAALTEARKSVFAAGCAVEWGTPVLYLRAPDGRIFDVNRTEAQKADPALRPVSLPSPVPPPPPPVMPPQPAPLVRPEPSRPEPVTRERTQTRAGRPWLWVIVGMVLMFVGFLALGAYINSQRSPIKPVKPDLDSASTTAQPAYSPIASFTPPEVLSKFQPEAAPPANLARQQDFGGQTPANSEEFERLKANIQELSKQQEEQSSILNAMDAQARKAIADIRSGESVSPSNQAYRGPTGQPGGAAGTSFRLVGTWGVVASPPYSVSRVQFQRNGRFAGQTTDGNGISRQVSGSVTYNPSTSMLAVNYDDGSWFQSRIIKWGAGFFTTFSFNGTQVEMYLEPENKTGY